MWLWRILLLTVSFTGSWALITLPEPTRVKFESVNFNNTLRWTQKGPPETVYDVEYCIYGDKVWKNKPECHHITVQYCDLTNEIVQENNWYYARVMAISKNINSTWSLSERFCPLDKTIIGPPAVEYTAGDRFITIQIHPPQVPPKGGIQRSIKDIFTVIKYQVQLNQSQTNKMVFYAFNESRYFKIESLEPNTNYCTSVQLSLRQEIFTKESLPANFCIRTSKERTLTVFLLVTFVSLGIIIAGIFSCVTYSYTKHQRTLPQSLNLDRILSQKCALLKQPPPTLQLTPSYKKESFKFVHLDEINLLKYNVNKMEEVIKTKQHILTIRPNSYAPQSHSRIMQANLPNDTDCEIQSNSSPRTTDNGCFAPYCPQAADRMSNDTCSSQNSSQALTQNYATIIHATPQNSTKVNTDPTICSAQNASVNDLQTMNEDIVYKNKGLIFQNGQELEVQILKVKEEKPAYLPSFVSLLHDKQQSYQTKWKEIQQLEIPLSLSLKDENQINPPLFQNGQAINSQSFLSLLNSNVGVLCLHSDRSDDQPVKVSFTDVLQTDLKDDQLTKTNLLKNDTFAGELLVNPEWKVGYKRQLLTYHSSKSTGQQTDASFLQTLQTNATMEGCKFLEDWEIQVHMDE
ncbi:interleukin-22 receptor subunit alpha-1-like [Stegostoma tigrinum]|uniref:interleukin-22 receptor subunit alpha-1-like n=1 Tax=Stegostoma tigrinum TaxID=3053191 RepID=UPI00202ACB6D|nr:interleukin-22 receptor subunit alpha-1-like [Stegostoma tigrinum]